MLEAHFAIPMIGAVLVCVNTQLSSQEYLYIIDHSDAKAVFVDNDFAALIQPIVEQLDKVSFFVNICDCSSLAPLDGPVYEQFLAGGLITAPEFTHSTETWSEDSLIAINYTSGTTGKPKGVMYSHRATCLQTLGEIIESALRPDSVYLWTLPMFHCNGWSFPWAVIAVGATHVYGLTELHGPYSICTWQAHWVDLDPEIVSKMKARQGVASITSLHLAVVDPQSMQPVPHDGQTMGEVVMRGHNVMLGYYKDPKATELAFRGGWFHSGDLGVVHTDGYLQITDRASDVIIRGGDKISSIEIEEIIYQHPDVLEVAVVSTPDPIWGEVPKAFVVPRQGRTPTAEDIIDFCCNHHAQFKAPKSVEFGQLPKTATGKTIKAKLRSREWRGLERKVS
jgi:acyl-CoA synthetase (AMP-forming)/AMP-acid ligase II